MHGMILAAGFGTRLRPLTWTVPKPMVPLCNRPLIAWAVESFVDAGIHQLIVNLHHLPEQIERYLDTEFGARAQIICSREEEILGTGGGVRRVRAILETGEDFYLVNGDTIQFPRYQALRAARASHDAIAALTLRHPPEGDRFTAVWLEEGLVNGFGSGHGESLMFAGSHIINARIFRHMPQREVFGIVEAVYQPILEQSLEKIAGVVDDGLWFDIGTPQRYLSASRAILEATARGTLRAAHGSAIKGTSLVHESAAVAGPAHRSTIGARSNIAGTITDSIVWEDCEIGRNVRLERCIVGHGVSVGGNLELTDAIICRDHHSIPADPGLDRHGDLVLSRFV